MGLGPDHAGMILNERPFAAECLECFERQGDEIVTRVSADTIRLAFAL